MNNEEKILAILEQMQGDIVGLKQGQAATNARLDTMQDDIDQIKEDTKITRETVNAIGEWTEVASDVLRIQYPLMKAE